jgi:UDP-glucuronate 4-epimerase
LLERGEEVFGLDNLNDCYDVRLKEARMARLNKRRGCRFVKVNIDNAEAITELFRHHQPRRVINLAAQPGVRYSLTHPRAYTFSDPIARDI